MNAILLLRYAILGKEISGALQGVGLDLQAGFLHEERSGRDSLALDLLEEMRAILADRLVLNLINRQQVTAKGFETDSLSGVRLKAATGKPLFQAGQAKKQEK